MTISKERLTEEIVAAEETIEKLKKIEIDSQIGVEVNQIVLKAFETELQKK